MLKLGGAIKEISPQFSWKWQDRSKTPLIWGGEADFDKKLKSGCFTKLNGKCPPLHSPPTEMKMRSSQNPFYSVGGVCFSPSGGCPSLKKSGLSDLAGNEDHFRSRRGAFLS